MPGPRLIMSSGQKALGLLTLPHDTIRCCCQKGTRDDQGGWRAAGTAKCGTLVWQAWTRESQLPKAARWFSLQALADWVSHYRRWSWRRVKGREQETKEELQDARISSHKRKWTSLTKQSTMGQALCLLLAQTWPPSGSQKPCKSYNIILRIIIIIISIPTLNRYGTRSSPRSHKLLSGRAGIWIQVWYLQSGFYNFLQAAESYQECGKEAVNWGANCFI